MRRLTICAAALLTLFWMAPLDAAFAQASTSQKCDDGSVVKVSTGTSGGNCTTVNGWKNCTDSSAVSTGGSNNVAIGGCVGGKATCGDTSGAGGCSITAKATTGNSNPSKVKTGLTSVSSAGTAKKSGSLGTSGNTTHTPITVTKKLDAASPNLMMNTNNTGVKSNINGTANSGMRR